PTLLFTPATKAAVGEHDENITWARMQELVGPALAEQLRQRSLAAFELGSRHAAQCGLLLADTKFEFGLLPGEPLGEGPAPSDRLLLIDEALTPDSSRFWPAAGYEPGRPQPSFDKQFVRDWLLRSGWDRNSPPPELPADVIDQTRAKYIEAYERLTGQPFAWA
ncbi:MAG TPA: phosphoribosylaminoimidazolesuccinocarboxamide synthase, partial [Lacipirellulaceae bacterium]|nr:phosphoribosylaminoimidazolesuccinocarboxamide synthase [Lacipirellulaceae bacterium]